MSWSAAPSPPPYEDVCCSYCCCFETLSCTTTYWQQSHQANHPKPRTVHLFTNALPGGPSMRLALVLAVPGDTVSC